MTSNQSNKPVNVEKGKQGFQPTKRGETTTNTPLPAPADEFRPGDWREQGDFRATLVELGEGLNGEYDENDPTDVELYRIDVQVKGTHPWADLDDDPEDGIWFNTTGETSLCTNFAASSSTEESEAFLAAALAHITRRSDTGDGSAKGALEDIAGWSEAPQSPIEVGATVMWDDTEYKVVPPEIFNPETVTIANEDGVETTVSVDDVSEVCDTCGAIEGTPAYDNHHDSQNCWAETPSRFTGVPLTEREPVCMRCETTFESFEARAAHSCNDY
ncbi:hypothetical protein [Aeromicrobium sp. 179-A 4D2 NHS]|uniref:hypothetical protein n=1 Tax=Aeromicrobium sp. 179-A 4D2 NHS TaxID=3142375 RepID=UPI0039A086F7